RCRHLLPGQTAAKPGISGRTKTVSSVRCSQCGSPLTRTTRRECAKAKPTHLAERSKSRMGRIFEKRKESIFKTAAQKSKLYSKYGRQLYIAAKNGVPDPEANPTLRSVIERAKRDNVASHVIEKAIQKAAGTGGEDFQAARYEGF